MRSLRRSMSKDPPNPPFLKKLEISEILLSVNAGPCSVGVVGIYGNAKNLSVEVLKVLYSLVQSLNFGGADKCEVEGVENKEQVLALVVIEAD